MSVTQPKPTLRCSHRSCENYDLSAGAPCEECDTVEQGMACSKCGESFETMV